MSNPHKNPQIILREGMKLKCVIHRHRFTIIPHYEQGNSAVATVGKTL